MSHSAPPTPSRRKYEVAGGIIALVLALASGAFAVTALKHPKGRQALHATALHSSTAAKKATPSKASHAPAATSSLPQPGSSQTPSATNAGSNRPAVIVLNNTSDASRTATALQRLQAAGWTASDGGSFDGSILSTAVYYDPTVSGAQAAASALQAQFPAIQRVKEKFSGLPQGALILILTSDYS